MKQNNNYIFHYEIWFFSRILLAVACILILMMCPTYAFSQEIKQVDDNKSNFYIGLAVGKTDLNNQGLFNNSNLYTNSTTNLIHNDEQSTSYKAYVGYKINKVFSIEGGYVDLGRFHYNRAERTATINDGGDISGSFKYKAGNIDLIGQIPLHNNFTVLGILGTHKGYLSNTTNNVGNLTNVPNYSTNNGLSVKYGIGAQYDINDHLSLRASLERYNFKNELLKKANTNMLSVNLVMPLTF